MTRIFEYIYLNGEINAKSVTPVIRRILSLNYEENDLDYIRLIIDSYGGELCSAFSLIDTIEGSRIPIHTFGVGQVCSAAIMILMSGSKGQRCVSKNVSLMSHPIINEFVGNSFQLESQIKSSKMEKEKQIKHYQRHTKLSREVITKELLIVQDVYLTIKEAISYNIIDRMEKLKND